MPTLLEIINVINADDIRFAFVLIGSTIAAILIQKHLLI
jgi:hypothetical protein